MIALDRFTRDFAWLIAGALTGAVFIPAAVAVLGAFLNGGVS